MKEIDIENWKRKEHYEFFSRMKSPSLGLTANVRCTNACRKAKENGWSLFAYYLHKSIVTVNSMPEFKYRIVGNKVVECDVVHATTTLLREDETFAFSFIEYDERFEVFAARLQNEIEEVKQSAGLRFSDEHKELNLIRYTTIPWLRFTAMLHPTNFVENESVPRISFGRIFEESGEKYLPLSIEANHALMDGLHVANHFKLFEELMND